VAGLRDIERPLWDRGAPRVRGERGAVLVEAALVFGLLFVLVFGIVEFGLQFKDSLAVSSAVRAGVRSATAQTRNPSYNTTTAAAVATAMAAVGNGAPQALWIYKADPATGYPINASGAADFSHGCTYCEQYSWSGTTWTCTSGCATTGAPNAVSWPANATSSPNGFNLSDNEYACTGAPSDPAFNPDSGNGTHTTGTYAGPDSIGVYLRIYHKNVTGFFGAGSTMIDHAVGRLEPATTTQGCYN